VTLRQIHFGVGDQFAKCADPLLHPGEVDAVRFTHQVVHNGADASAPTARKGDGSTATKEPGGGSYSPTLLEARPH
jgi:hypothetical protein